MAWRPHSRARTNPRDPRAWARCDRCGFTYNLIDLVYDYQYSGPGLWNTGLKVCRKCSDEPNEQLRTVTLPPDPPPVQDPRPPRAVES